MNDQYTELKFNSSKSQIWCPLKEEFRKATPEEVVRQGYILRLHIHYGYAIEQMDQDLATRH